MKNETSLGLERDPEKSEKMLEEIKSFFEQIYSTIKDETPEKWLCKTYRILINAREGRIKTTSESGKEIYKETSKEMKEFISEIFPDILDVLKTQVDDETLGKVNGADTHENARAQLAIQIIKEIAKTVGKIIDRGEGERLEGKNLSLEQILKEKPEVFRLGVKSLKEIPGATLSGNPEIDDKEIDVLLVRASTEDPWYAIPLPQNENFYHKGGAPRIILKILADAPIDTIRAELPPNDFDAMIERQGGVSDVQIFEDAKKIGVDPDGVEIISELILSKYYTSRDVTFNQALFGKNGIQYSKKAFESARSGVIDVGNNEVRDLYGTESFFYDGIRFVKNRGMYRLIKFVAEDKALSFEWKSINEQIDFSIYWLVLARKFARKKDMGVLLEKMFYLAKQMGQVKDEEKDVFDCLNRVHAKYSFFDFEDKPLDDVGVARWLTSKLSKFTQKIYREYYDLHFNFKPQRKEGDDISRTVSLKDFILSENPPNQDKWKNFIKRCRERTIKTNNS